jgi:PEP-CTERM motif
VFHASENWLESITGVGNNTVTFSRPEADIGGFVLLVSSRFEGIDNLRFNAPAFPPVVVPEPQSIAMLVSGLAAIALGRLRGKARRVETE